MINAQKPSSLSRYWLLLGVGALAIAGLFSLVLVIARTPSLSELNFFDALFHKSLVVHVDLSVLIWFLCIAAMMWSLLCSGTKQIWPYLEEAALLCTGLGTLAMAVSPLDPNSQALMSNYIPVLASSVFFTGLALLLCGMLLMLTRMLTSKRSAFFNPAMQFGVWSAGIIAAIAALEFFWSFSQVPTRIGINPIQGQAYYDMLFWGGGHTLQFVHTQILLVAWVMLMQALKPDFRLPDMLLQGLFAIGLMAACVTVLPYLFTDATTQEFRDFFTHIMIVMGGFVPVLLAIVIVVRGLWRSPKFGKNALHSSLIMSIALFLYGGFLGSMIVGQNVVIPAHYHGSIVGVTLAFMGVAYALLPQFGYRDVSAWKMAFWQPIIYGSGQVLHISGLAWSGGYGVLRKTPGGLDNVSASVKAAMGLMGLGGVIAIIGGFLFVIVVARSVYGCQRAVAAL
jgi:cytochrome c oxidase subunit 1